MMKLLRALLLLLLVLSIKPAYAHVGSKDVFEQVYAGPYKLFVTIRMPNVIPGVANIEVRSTGAPVTGIDITPLPLTGEAAKHPPSSDPMKASAPDPAFFSGAVWMMASGSMQIRFKISGPAGNQTTSVPVPTVAISTLTMDRNLGIILGILGLFLVLTMAGVVAAAIRESHLQSGSQPTAILRRRGLIAMLGSLAFMALLLYGGAKWWNVEAAGYSRGVYRPLKMEATLSGEQLKLDVQPYNPENKFRARSNDDFIPDHGHLMHLYAIRQPGMDAVYHLHPTLDAPGDFRLDLPSMPPGTYTLYGDVVHANGFPETLVTTVTIPAAITITPVIQFYSNGRPKPVNSDDASALAPPITSTPLGNSFRLPDSYTMVWDAPATLTSGTPYTFHFHLLAPDGKPAPDMQPYMGMAGHAAFVKTDGTVFAHVHPDGSAAMAAVMIANPSPRAAMPDMPDMTGMSHPPGASQDPNANTVDFPYGFPTPGRYRIFVQMKHNTTVETGVFDAHVQ
jgi:hypothetical protein